jgi:tripartite-type tricarboxylate transporter receptor subunit TctC
MNLRKLSRVPALLLCALGLQFAASVHADTYPSKAIKIIVPFAPGGGSDFIARFIAQRLSTAVGQPVMIDNRPGAGGNLGIDVGLASPADGYTVVLVASSYTTNQVIYKIKYDPVNDITPIIQLSQGPMVVVANNGFAPKSAKEIIAAAKAKPGEITFASAGAGSITHMTGELFASQAGIKLNHIPYKGTNPALTDTIGGQTNLFFATTASAIPQIQGGKLRAVGVTTATRLPALPTVPTIAESGLPGFDVAIWHGLIGPKGMPKEVVARLNSEINKILAVKETGETLLKDGVFPAGGTPEKFTEQIKKELAVWKKLMAEGNIKPE